MRSYKTLFILLIIAALPLFAFGCQKTKPAAVKNKPAKTTKKAAEPKNLKSHDLSAKDTGVLIGDIKKDIEILTKAHETTSELTKGYTGQALIDINNGIKTDLAAGKQKIRAYKDSKVNVTLTIMKAVGVDWTYTDMSYYVDLNNKNSLSNPEGKPRHFALAAIKEKGRWKISRFMEPAKK